MNHNSMIRSRQVIHKHAYQLDVTHAGDTNQTTFTQTLLPPNALILSPSTTQLTFTPRQQTTQLVHTKITPFHQPKPPMNHNSMIRSRQVHLQTYVSTLCNACWWHELHNVHTNPSASQRTHTFTKHHPTHIHPPPTNHSTCTHKNHATTNNLPHPFNIHLTSVLISHP
jgi:hypothetical protein